MTPPLTKYPRTQHVEGSRLQAGDFDLSAVPFRELRGKQLVVEEKLDGANCALSFDDAGALLLQSRGHYLRGGASERQFALLKTWANVHQAAFREALGSRYVCYGEWLYAKHTVFYDRLPHYFMEFDVYDRETKHFLSTPRRRALLAGLNFASVPVLHEGALESLDQVRAFVRPARFKSPGWREAFGAQCEARDYALARAWSETDRSELSEGLYLKWEQDGQVLGRYKFVRASFLSAVFDSGSHWQDRPLLPNLLAEGVDLFGAGA